MAARPRSDRRVRDVAVVETDALLRDVFIAAISNDTGLRCVASGAHVDELGGNGTIEAVVVSAPTPGPDVLGQALAARRRHPQATVVVIAGHVDAALIERLRGAGATSVVSTEQPFDDLVAAVAGNRATSAPSCRRQELAERRAKELGITRREQEALRLLGDGKNVASIAYCLGISAATCRDHIKHLREKLRCQSAIEVVVTAFRLGLLPELNRPMP